MEIFSAGNSRKTASNTFKHAAYGPGHKLKEGHIRGMGRGRGPWRRILVRKLVEELSRRGSTGNVPRKHLARMCNSPCRITSLHV